MKLPPKMVYSDGICCIHGSINASVDDPMGSPKRDTEANEALTCFSDQL